MICHFYEDDNQIIRIGKVIFYDDGLNRSSFRLFYVSLFFDLNKFRSLTPPTFVTHGLIIIYARKLITSMHI